MSVDAKKKHLTDHSELSENLTVGDSFLNMIKNIGRKHLANFVYKGERLDYFLPWDGEEDTSVIQAIMGVSASTKG